MNIAQRGTSALLKAGLVTSAEVAAPSTTFLLTDDPLDSANLYFALVLAKPDVESVSQSLKPIVAVLDRRTLGIQWLGTANWHQGQ